VSRTNPLTVRRFAELRPEAVCLSVAHCGAACVTSGSSICLHRATLVPSASLAGEPPYEAVLGLGEVWVNGRLRLVVDPPAAAYATREGDAHPSGIGPAAVRLAELRVAAMAAAISRGASMDEAVASGHAAVAAALAEGWKAGVDASEGYGAGAAMAGGVAPAGEGGGSAGAGSAVTGGAVAGSAEASSAPRP